MKSFFSSGEIFSSCIFLIFSIISRSDIVLLVNKLLADAQDILISDPTSVLFVIRMFGRKVLLDMSTEFSPESSRYFVQSMFS